ncbi:MAG: sigma-54-dependent Fis family transcriptional regulator [Acidobacteria bacterium]|nr:sigma-54-dependent Fis family transcriptional regulator [Acidobacteriota bacterium]
MVKSRQSNNGNVAVIDDDEATRRSFSQMLRLRGYDVEAFSSAEAALNSPGSVAVDCIISDVKMPGMDGEQFLLKMKTEKIPPPVIMITGHGDISMAVRCLKAGAYDFIEKPFDNEIMLATVARSVETSRLRRDSADLRRRIQDFSSEEEGRFGMVGRSASMQDLYTRIETVSKSDAPVLIFGETGSGKELVARAIHAGSARSGGPFVPINVGALPETMVESELFGHSRGAFTGAESERDGLLVTASGGTLLLDEIETISEKTQIQLLRVLEDGMVQPLGRDKPEKVDVRLLITTKQNLRDLVNKNYLREDFYHRIAVLQIRIPPLRERADDIPLLVSYFIKKASTIEGVPVPKIPENSLAAMLRYSWPGNVRELINSVRRMVITAHNGVIGSFSDDAIPAADHLLSLPSSHGLLRTELEKTEKNIVRAALAEHAGEINATCQALGISRRSLYDRMIKYRLRKENFKA